MKFSKEEKSHSNNMYRKLYAVWHHMIARCYNNKDKSYHSYGLVGVRVSKEWLTFDGFANDVESVKGWDYEGFMKSNLQLDKDFMVKGNKLYSLSTCCWISRDKNVSLRPNLMSPFIVIDSNGKKSNIIYSKTEACKNYDINMENLSMLLNNDINESLNGYQAVYIKELRMHKYPKTVYYMDRSSVVHRFYSKRQAINSIDELTIDDVSRCLNKVTASSKGYQFSYDGKNFLDPNSIQYNINKYLKENIRYLVTDRTLNTEYCIINEKLFSEYSGIAPKVIHRNALFSLERVRKPTANYVITKFNKFSNDYRKDSLLINE